MPELPEVETACRGIAAHLIGQRVAGVTVRERRLRWPVPAALAKDLPGQMVRTVWRRGKYILIGADTGTLLLHLGMSGSVRMVACRTPPQKFDHVDIALANGQCLRLRDPRRFGSLLWTRGDPLRHKLLKNLGPEPLGPDFSGAYLYQAARGRKLAVRDFLMNTRVLAGVGNIYANEALFLAGIRPNRAAGKVSRERYERLALAIRETLEKAIRAGGTTLRDFQNADGLPGYFQQTLNVYGRKGEPCRVCHKPIRARKLGQRSAFFCPNCQT
jgi:formamidopyrimidine-DNA glycosylase